MVVELVVEMVPKSGTDVLEYIKGGAKNGATFFYGLFLA